MGLTTIVFINIIFIIVIITIITIIIIRIHFGSSLQWKLLGLEGHGM